VAGTLTLAQLAGLQTMTNVLMVGKGGPASRYTTLTDALATIPPSASSTNPYVVLVGPGVYEENVILNSDGVTLFALGSVRVTAPSGSTTAALTIQADGSVVPKGCKVIGFSFVNPNSNRDCVRIYGLAGSEVGSEWLSFLDCDFEASGDGAYQIRADTADFIRVQGGSWSNSHVNSRTKFTNCARVVVEGVQDAKDFTLLYDTTGSVPSEVSSEYRLAYLSGVDTIACTLSGAGSLFLDNVSQTGNLTVDGDRPLDASFCRFGNLTVNGTVEATLSACSRGTATGSGTSTLAESYLSGSASFTADDTGAVAFDVGQPDTDYSVSLELGANAGGLVPASVETKTVSGFDIVFDAAQTTTVGYTVTRKL